MSRKDLSLVNSWVTDLLSHCGKGVSSQINFYVRCVLQSHFSLYSLHWHIFQRSCCRFWRCHKRSCQWLGKEWVYKLLWFTGKFYMLKVNCTLNSLQAFHLKCSFFDFCFLLSWLILELYQRFGSGSVPTHLIGAALLRGEWKSAANLILDPREGDILKIYSSYLKTHITQMHSCY